MSFFNSEVVRAEMAKISEMQEEIYKNVFEFSSYVERTEDLSCKSSR
jgi:hypothetical protein